MKATKYGMIQSAWGGISGEAQGRCSMSGAYRLLLTVARDGAEGCAVVVAPAESGSMSEAWVRASVSGPMLNLDLGADEVEPFNRDDLNCLTARAISESDNEYGALIRLAKACEGYGGFDYVGLGKWLEIRRTAGARIGRKVGSRIVWEDGTPDTELPASDAPDADPGLTMLAIERALIPHKLEAAHATN